MAKTLANLRTGVRVYLDESAQTDFLDSEVDRSINYAYQDLASEVVEVYEGFYLTTTPIYITTVANTREYSLDSSLIKIQRVEINYKPSDSNNKPMRALALKLDELPRALSDTATGSSGLFNCGYYVTGNQSAQIIGLVPAPTEGGTNAVSVWGVQMPSDLSASTDPVVIPYADRYSSLIELHAAAILLRKGQQEEAAAARYMQEYMIGVQRMKTFLKERQADGPWVIEDALLEDVAMDFSL